MGFKVKYIWENDWDKYNSGKIDNIKKYYKMITHK